MKQRMVMVISTLLDPSLLIADEITSALDVSTQRAVAETLVSFRDHGFVKSMIVITHDISILYQIADTILVMYAGKLAEKAPTKRSSKIRDTPTRRMLISSLPEVGVRYANKKLSGIPGSPPALLNPPTGCRFRARCPLAFDRCAEEPPFIDIAADHSVACWKATGSRCLASTESPRSYKVGTFGGKELMAVRDVSFDVDEGEVVSLIGESGSGKTTIGKMVLKLIEISRGSITCDGMDVAAIHGGAVKAYYRHVQGVFQDPFSSYNPIFKADRVFSMIAERVLPQHAGFGVARQG